MCLVLSLFQSLPGSVFRQLHSPSNNSQTMMPARSYLARPPYVDPTTNVIYDTDNPEYQGWLTKQSMWLKVRTQDVAYCVAVGWGGLLRVCSLDNLDNLGCLFGRSFLTVLC